MKVFELAKQLNVKAVDLLKQLQENGEDVKSINTNLSEDQEKMISEVITGSDLGVGQFKTNIAFVRKLEGENYELCLGVVDEKNNLEVTQIKKYQSRVRAYSDLSYYTGLIEMERAVNV